MEEESQFLGNEDCKHAVYKELPSGTYTVLSLSGSIVELKAE